MSYEPIAYTYEADHHCPACALARFGRDSHGDITGTDNEGNAVGAVFGWDEWQSEMGDECEYLTCGDCLTVIEEWHSELCAATDRHAEI